MLTPLARIRIAALGFALAAALPCSGGDFKSIAGLQTEPLPEDWVGKYDAAGEQDLDINVFWMTEDRLMFNRQAKLGEPAPPLVSYRARKVAGQPVLVLDAPIIIPRDPEAAPEKGGFVLARLAPAATDEEGSLEFSTLDKEALKNLIQAGTVEGELADEMFVISEDAASFFDKITELWKLERKVKRDGQTRIAARPITPPAEENPEPVVEPNVPGEEESPTEPAPAEVAEAEPVEAPEPVEKEEGTPKENTVEAAKPVLDAPADTGLRTWVDSTGRLQIEARFLRMVDDRVMLETTRGNKLTIPLKRFSQQDQEFLQELR